jgi:stearoyl-CoA desaturase (delta-9 desaturase)
VRSNPSATLAVPAARPRPPLTDRLENVFLLLMHLALLFVFLVPLSPKIAALAIGGYVVRMWAITTGYHRLLAHRAFSTSRVFQFLLSLIGAMSLQNGPLWWASWHRRHHKHTDTFDDVHSPSCRGFWHAHMGWFLDGSHGDPDLSNVRDLSRYPELRWLDRHTWIPLFSYAAICAWIGGVPGLLYGFCVSSLALFHATLFINSLAHTWGTRTYATADTSRNNFLLAILTMGEGWHNNHHKAQSYARQGFRWWQVDVSYYVIRLLALVGIVWDVREPPRDLVLGVDRS